jgi:hypothetical protein
MGNAVLPLPFPDYPVWLIRDFEIDRPSGNIRFHLQSETEESQLYYLDISPQNLSLTACNLPKPCLDKTIQIIKVDPVLSSDNIPTFKVTDPEDMMVVKGNLK